MDLELDITLDLAKKVIIGVIVFGVTGIFAYFVITPLYLSGRTPAQPIEFSHKIHAGDNEIPCQYCHLYTEKSRHAGVPNVKRCMGCHAVIKTDSPEIIKLTQYWERKEPVPWVKVHNLADYVYFPHKRHVKAGVNCKECHGDIASMGRVKRVSSLGMGWCLTCHIKRDVKNGMDCWTCHQ